MSDDASSLWQKPRTARLVIADDHELARAGLRAMLAGQPELEVVGEAANGKDAVDLCKRLQPDLVLLDVRMPGQDGLATCQAIKLECPATSVILITVHEDPKDLLEAFKAGAAGYVLKDISRYELVTALQRVLRGESMLNKEVVIHMLESLAKETPSVSVSANLLTPREHEVLQLLTQGLTNREIARKLIVSVSTVKIHVEHILAKLDVSDRTQAAVRAIELGLLRIVSGE